MNSCTECKKSFTISPEEHAFLDKISPTVNGKKYLIPEPTLCPQCRLRIRVSHRNEQYLYKNVSAKSGAPIVSLYTPDSGKNLKLYTHDEWWSDDWDALEYSQDFDFSRGFFEQFNELLAKVPHVALIQVGNENCPFTTGTGYCKNCHLINSSENCEDCYYGKLLQSSRDVMDSCYAYDSELLYECFYVKKCYNCAYVNYSQNCNDCWFSENLKGCKNCFLCTNLSNKEYYFMNEPLDKQYYEDAMRGFLGSYNHVQKAKEILQKLREKRIYKYGNIINCENSTGDFLSNCKNCIDSYDVNDSQDCRYVTVGVNVKDLMDCSNMYLKPELCYQVLGTIGVYNCIFCLYLFNGQDMMYSQFCYNSKNLFGCVGLHNKQYCIFNKQYSKEEYEKRVAGIIEHMQRTGEWGMYFPSKLSPFAYNESVAQEYLPLTKNEAQARGLSWHDSDQKENVPQTYVIPDRIKDVNDAVLNETLACEICGKNFRIISQELTRLRKMQIPLPHVCPDCRYLARMKLRNARTLYQRNCAQCGVEISSTFSPDRPEKIYCEKCYQQEVY